MLLGLLIVSCCPLYCSNIGYAFRSQQYHNTFMPDKLLKWGRKCCSHIFLELSLSVNLRESGEYSEKSRVTFALIGYQLPWKLRDKRMHLRSKADRGPFSRKWILLFPFKVVVTLWVQSFEHSLYIYITEKAHLGEMSTSAIWFIYWILYFMLMLIYFSLHGVY